MSEAVTLTFPADLRNTALSRSLSAAMSARADLLIDQLEDVRLAIDEAVVLAIADAPAGSDITCAFHLAGAELRISVSAISTSGLAPSQETFSWTVLSALVDSVEATVDGGRVSLDLRITKRASVDA